MKTNGLRYLDVFFITCDYNMGIDTFCPLSGLHWFERLTFVHHIFEGLHGDVNDPDENSATDTYAVLERGLTHSVDDSEQSRSYAMICVAPASQKLTGVDDLLYTTYAIGDYQCPRLVDETNTMEVFNLVAANTSGEVDEYSSLDLTDEDGSPIYFLHHCFQTGLAVNFWAYLIFRHACPRVLPHILFKMYRDQTRSFDKKQWWGTFWGVNYGPTRGINDQYVDWCGLGKCRDEDEAVWPALLCRQKSIPGILDDAWNGDGALWTTVRPNKFPIVEAASAPPLFKFSAVESWEVGSHLAACPPEILLEIAKHLSPREFATILATSKKMRGSFQRHVNHLTYRYMRRHQPWLLPAGPVPFSDSRFGREEVDAWAEGWSKAGIDSERIKTDIPWFMYARECSKDLSMRSRRRIWGIAKQIENLAIQDNYI